MAIETAHEMSDLDKLLNIFETIEGVTLQTSNPEEIRKALQAMPNFDIEDLSLDAEIYFALAMRLSSSPYPDEEAIERCGMTEQEIEADLAVISTLQKVIKTLGDSIDISYFEIQPKGDDLEKIREVRSSAIKSVLHNLEI